MDGISFLQDAFHGVLEQRSLVNRSWLHQFSYTNTWITRCFTLNLTSLSLGTDNFVDSVG